MKTIQEVLNKVNNNYNSKGVELNISTVKSDDKIQDGCIDWLEVEINFNNSDVTWVNIHVPNSKVNLQSECATTVLTTYVDGVETDYPFCDGIEMHNIINRIIHTSINMAS